MSVPSDAEKKLAGGVAVITGAGAGIGAGFAKRVAGLGMTVYVTGRTLSNITKVAKDINEANGSSRAEAIQVDVSRPEELERLADTVFGKHKSVRLLINNAAIETMGYSWEIPADRWETTLNTNIHGVIHGVRAFAPRMIDSGEECWIANVSSVGGLCMMPKNTAYVVTRHAVQAFSECLYLEMQLKGAPIHVSAVLPGVVKTGIFDAHAGKGEPEDAASFRATMCGVVNTHGMDVDEACQVMLAGIMEGSFWVSSQPEMTADLASKRADFLNNLSDPSLDAEGKALLGVQ